MLAVTIIPPLKMSSYTYKDLASNGEDAVKPTLDWEERQETGEHKNKTKNVQSFKKRFLGLRESLRPRDKKKVLAVILMIIAFITVLTLTVQYAVNNTNVMDAMSTNTSSTDTESVQRSISGYEDGIRIRQERVDLEFDR